MNDEKWDIVIYPKSSWFNLKLGEVWKFRDLIFMFIKRDFIAQYKQTILGPIWFIIQPLITTITYLVVFGGIAIDQFCNGVDAYILLTFGVPTG